MAIVQTGVTRNGVRYKIDDRYAAMPGTPEYKRIAAEQCRIAHRILVNEAMAREKARKVDRMARQQTDKKE